MWLEVNLKTSFFQPEKLEKGLWFINSLYPGTDKEFFELWELEENVPENQVEEFLAKNGFPVEIVLTVEMENLDEPDDVIVYFEEIGWFYDLDTELMDIIDLKQINSIIQDYGGKVFLLIDEKIYDDLEQIVPEMENNLVIVTYPFEEEYEEE